MIHATCATCNYVGTAEGDGSKLRCHRYAPTPLLVGRVRWPEVAPADWCGEWALTDTPTAQAPETPEKPAPAVLTPKGKKTAENPPQGAENDGSREW